MLPKDPYMLLSVINTALRDGKYADLNALAAANGADGKNIEDTLAKVGYIYDAGRNTFLQK